MPRYTSDTSRSLGQLYIVAGEPLDAYEFVQALPVGVVRDDTKFLFDPILDSKKYTSTTTYTIPATNSGYKIELNCTAGEVDVKFNTTGTSLLLAAGMSFSLSCRDRIINTIQFTISSGTIYVKVVKE